MHDDLETFVEERTADNADFPLLVAAAERRRQLFRKLAALRQDRDQSQHVVGELAHTSQSAIARLESGSADCRFSTAERFAAALGYEIQFNLVPVTEDDDPAPTVEARRKEKRPHGGVAVMKSSKQRSVEAPATPAPAPRSRRSRRTADR